MQTTIDIIKRYILESSGFRNGGACHRRT